MLLIVAYLTFSYIYSIVHMSVDRPLRTSLGETMNTDPAIALVILAIMIMGAFVYALKCVYDRRLAAALMSGVITSIMSYTFFVVLTLKDVADVNIGTAENYSWANLPEALFSTLLVLSILLLVASVAVYAIAGRSKE